MATRVRLGYVTAEQKETILEFLKQNPQLKSGKFSAIFTAKDAQKMWITLAEELHKIPNGAVKEWKQWRQTWQDLCSKTKTKNSKLNIYRKGTGGGPPTSVTEQLTPSEQQILETLSTTAISGHKNIAETNVSFNFEDVEYLDEYLQNPEEINMEEINVNNNEATTYNMQKKQDGTMTVHIENRVIPTDDTENNDNIIENLPLKDTKQKSHVQNQKQSGKRTVAGQRLDKTVEYTNDLVHLTNADQEMRKKYYRKKIKLMKRNIIVKERIASALENITNVYPFTFKPLTFKSNNFST